VAPVPSDRETPAADPQSYEAARDELVEIVRALEQGGLSLEESLALWERGESLAAACQDWLDGARARLDAVMSGTDDQPDADDDADDDG
jgi:exodeoxyribonuclease VII small subunit